MANEKTNLAEILTVSGYSGLYKFIAQSRSGAIAQALATGVRVNLPATGKITSLEDIAIYTEEEEMRLREVFEAMHNALGDAEAPSAKAGDAALKEFFGKAVPDYDGSRFYVSHMKKVVTWYNELKAHATLDFVNPEEEQAAQETAQE